MSPFRFCKNLLLCSLTAVVFYACQHNPYRQTNKAYKKQAKAFGKVISQKELRDTASYITPVKWVGTTNFNMRKPNLVVIHHTAQNSCDQTLKTFTMPRTSVSAHYVICEDGTVHHMLNDYLRAWHGGVGKWGNITEVNSTSIGIEIDNDGFEKFAEKQMVSLELLLTQLKKAYNIPQANFIGHADIAPTRKNDPNVNFDWRRIADKGFGNWYGDTTNVQVPPDFKPLLALKMIGYDIRDSTATLTTFKRKFLQNEDRKPLTNSDKKVLYAVWIEAMK
ncbi:MAG: N-acetylmuramoyl-L-alanine amidase [Spirosomataceae bacterium]|jgi:N-acetylmuramoyl-L-alanine amidase